MTGKWLESSRCLATGLVVCVRVALIVCLLLGLCLVGCALFTPSPDSGVAPIQEYAVKAGDVVSSVSEFVPGMAGEGLAWVGWLLTLVGGGELVRRKLKASERGRLFGPLAAAPPTPPGPTPAVKADQ